MKIEKGQMIDIKIEKIVYGGEGLGYYNNELQKYLKFENHTNFISK